MNCTEFEQVVVETARRELMETTTEREALAHAKMCARCARRLANEQKLSAVVAAAVRDDNRRVAPAAAEQMLVAEFRKQHAGSKRQRAWWARAAIGAVAAALMLAAAVGLRRSPEPTVQTATKPAEVRVKPREVPVVSPAVRELSKPRMQTAKVSQRKALKRLPAEPLAPPR